jgi:hypothetical protein
MKTKLVVLILAFSEIIIAQDECLFFRKKLMFGPKIGLNLSNVYDAKGELFNADSKVGLAVGGFISIPISKYLGVQPEVLVSQKGFQATGFLIGSSYSFTRTTTYMAVPLLLAFKPTEYFTLLVGPQYSYLMNQKDVFGTATTTIEQITQFSNDNIRKNTMSLLIGVDFKMARVVIGSSAGWDVQSNQRDRTSSTPRYKNMWYQATIGYRF